MATGAQVETLDVNEDASIAALATKFTGKPLDLLINNAGIMLRMDTLKNVKSCEMEKTLRTNTIAPLMVTSAFYDHLKLAKKEGNSMPIVAHVSSNFASISGNKMGNMYSLRASKTALNAIAKSMAVDLKKDGIAVALLTPGHVKTNMTKNQGTATPEESVGWMTKLIDEMDMSKSGVFFNTDGKTLPW